MRIVDFGGGGGGGGGIPDPHASTHALGGTDALVASFNPGAAAALLRTDTAGGLQLLRFGLGVAPSLDNVLSVVSGGRIGFVSPGGRIEFSDLTPTDAINLLGCNVGIGTSTPGQTLEVSGYALVSRNPNPGIYLRDNSQGANLKVFRLLNTSGYFSIGCVDDVYSSGTALLNVLRSGAVGIGTIAPAASSLLDLTSTTKGFLITRMTTAQRVAIGSPATGLLVFDTDLGLATFYTGAAWNVLSPTGKGLLAARPAAGIAGRLYFVADSGSERWARDTGAAWEDCGPDWDYVGGKPTTFAPTAHGTNHNPGGSDAVTTAAASGLANANAEGTAASLARSDHAHKRDVRVAQGGVDVGTRNRINFTGAGVAVTDDVVNDEVDVVISSGGGGAPTDASYVVIATNASLSAERTLAAGGGLTLTDGGAEGAATLAVGAGLGLTVNADDVALTTPGTLTPTTTNASTGNHTHAVTPGTPVSVNVANAEGDGASFARNNHKHAEMDVQALGTVSTNQTVDFSAGKVATMTLGGNIQISLTSLGSSVGATCWLKLIQDATGNRVPTWGGTNIGWPGGTAVPLSTGANDVDYLTFFWDGSTFVCSDALFDVS